MPKKKTKSFIFLNLVSSLLLVSKKITIEVDMVSVSAAEAVTKAGGEVVSIGSGRL